MTRRDWIWLGVLIGLLMVLVADCRAQLHPTPIQPQARDAWGEQYGPPAPPRRPLAARTAPLCWTVLHPQGQLTKCSSGSWRLLRAIDGAVVEGEGEVVLPIEK